MIMWTAIEIITNFYEGFLMVYFIKKRLCGRFLPIRKTDVIPFLLIGFLYCAWQMFEIPLSDALIDMIPFLYGIYISNKKWYYNLFWTFVLSIVMTFSVVLTSRSIELATGASWDVLMMPSMQRLLFIITANASITFFVIIFSGINGKGNNLSWKNIVLFLVAMCAEYISIELLFAFQVDIQTDSVYPIIISGILFLSMVLTLLLYESMNSSALRHQQTELTLQHLQNSLEHQNDLRMMYNHLLANQHDFKHRIALIEETINQNEAIDAAEMKKLLSSIAPPDPSLTGKFSVDAILTAKIAYAKSKDIEFSFSPYPLPALNVSEMDFCILLSNLLDNAIEGILRIPHISPANKRLLLTFARTRNMFFITCKNDYLPSTIQEDNGCFLSSKRDSVFHGFGTESMKAIVNKAGGWIEFRPSEPFFLVHILLPVEEGS